MMGRLTGRDAEPSNSNQQLTGECTPGLPFHLLRWQFAKAPGHVHLANKGGIMDWRTLFATALALGALATSAMATEPEDFYTFKVTYEGTEFVTPDLTADQCAALVAKHIVEIMTEDGTSLIVPAADTKRACVSTYAERAEKRAARAKAEAEAAQAEAKAEAEAKARAEAEALRLCRSLLQSNADNKLTPEYSQRNLKLVCFASDGSERVAGAKAALDAATTKVEAGNRAIANAVRQKAERDAIRLKAEQDKREAEKPVVKGRAMTTFNSEGIGNFLKSLGQ
jgi:hypothetical protein